MSADQSLLAAESPSAPAAGLAVSAAAPALPGVRLGRLQLRNFGTYANNRIAQLSLDGCSTLLTGQQGTGKSTFVDALTALLVSPQRLHFNAAAGALRSERSLHTYALGQVGTLTTGDGNRPDTLRQPGRHMSWVLATFLRAGEACVSAGMVLYYRDVNAPAPERIYFTVPGDLDLAQLTGLTDVKMVRRRLTELGAAHTDTFVLYQTGLRRALGTSVEALELLVRTVSMKQITDLTTFVREHMLDGSKSDEWVNKVIEHFGNLTTSHDEVRKAKDQIEALKPVIQQWANVSRNNARIQALEAAAAALPAYVSTRRARLLDERIRDLEGALLPDADRRVRALEAEEETAQRRARDLEAALDAAGGAALPLAERDLDAADARLNGVRELVQAASALAEQANVDVPAAFTGEPRERFDADCAKLHLNVEADLNALRAPGGEAYRLAAAAERAREAARERQQEIAAAAGRPSNIPSVFLGIRDSLAQDCGIEASKLPFVGELVAVADTQREWERAAETLVRPFALSLLVPEQLYAQVASWVDGAKLPARLTYHRVPAGAAASARPVAGSLAQVLVVKPSTQVGAWLSVELARTYTHLCVRDAAGLADAPRAVTIQGQVRDGARHVKDADRSLNDRTRWVLGWDSAERLAALREGLPALLVEAERAEAAAAGVDARRDALTSQLQALRGLAQERFAAALVDVDAALLGQQAALAHLNALRSDPTLAQQQRALDGARAALTQVKERLGTAQGDRGGLRSELRVAQQQRADLVVVAEPYTSAVADQLERAQRACGDVPTRPSECDTWLARLGGELHRERSSAANTLREATRLLTGAMNKFTEQWRTDANIRDLDPSSPEGALEFVALHDRLVRDDLPRFLDKFRAELRLNVAQEIAGLSRKLEGAARTIQDRLGVINAALRDVDYSEGADPTILEMRHDRAQDDEVREFRRLLTQLVEGGMTMSEASDDDLEVRFERCRELLDRLRGREGTAESDRRWRVKVTDVRRWFTFSAVELTRETGVERALYNDSSGMSGGEKEKLAYTMLAAAVAYQYGLADPARREAAFRLVVIDEAFSKGPDAAARFGMRLFTGLGLQVLVLTPMLKVTTLEHFVARVGYVSKRERVSLLTEMTLEEFQAQRSAYRSARQELDSPPSPLSKDAA